MSSNVLTFDALTLCEDKGGYYEVDPAVMFPATLQRIQEVLAGEAPVEIVSKDWTGHPVRDPVVGRFLDRAEAFPKEAWKKPTAELLDFAESWFKRALALRVGHGLRIHIKRDPAYKR